jgi:hypothetical protein
MDRRAFLRAAGKADFTPLVVSLTADAGSDGLEGSSAKPDRGFLDQLFCVEQPDPAEV